MTIRVYLIDDHALVRTGMKMILASEMDIEVVGDWEPVDPKEHAAIDVINCVSNLLEKLKLKHKPQ